MLTDLTCKKAKPESKNRKLRDGKGLYLFITKTGGKSWRYDFKVKRPNNTFKNGTMVLGSYPALSLADARQKHAEAKILVSQGIDPHEDKKQKKRKELQSRAITFADIAHEWLEIRQSIVKPKTLSDIKNRLECDVFPEIGVVPIGELNSLDILYMLKKIESRGAIEMASRARQYCSKIFQYAVIIEKAERDITTDIQSALAKRKVKHQPALMPHDIPEFLTALERNEPRLHLETRYALELLMLTFVRPIELASAEWQDFDFNDGQWIIPAEKMKMDNDHIVPLSKQALAIIHKIKLQSGNRQYLFPNAKDPKRHMSRDTLSKAVRLLGFQGRHSAHGFRAMARTAIREKLNWNSEIIERQLAHKPSGSLGSAYDRTQFIDQRKIMMQSWSDYLENLASNKTVIFGNFEKKNVG